MLSVSSQVVLNVLLKDILRVCLASAKAEQMVFVGDGVTLFKQIITFCDMRAINVSREFRLFFRFKVSQVVFFLWIC